MLLISTRVKTHIEQFSRWQLWQQRSAFGNLGNTRGRVASLRCCVYKNEPLANFCEPGSSPAASSPWQSEMELPLTFKDSSVEVIIERLPAVLSQEIGKWHMGPGTKQNRRYSLARGGGDQRKG